MKDRFQKYLAAENLFSKEDKLILGISGGADSVALASLLSSLGYNISFAHCNFNLRGDESKKDERFVREYSRQLQVELYVESFDTYQYAKKKKISIQMAARELRFEWFESLRHDTGSKYVLLAHHADDNIETFFINLIRGSGIRGFLGIKSVYEKIIRPLIPFSRQEIEDYLGDINQDFRHDSSNDETKYLRNNIRHNLMPMIKELNPSFERTLINEQEYLNDVFNIYIESIDKVKPKVITTMDKDRLVIDIKQLTKHKYYSVILREILIPYGFNQIDKIINAFNTVSGKIFESDLYMLLINRDEIIISCRKDYSNNLSVNISKDLDEITDPINLIFSISDSTKWEEGMNIAYLDFDKLTFPLTIRRWVEGDVFFPLGMTDKKKLSDFFIDNKFSLFDKKNCWLLCSENDIVWIIGHRIDDRFKITKTTKKSYIAKLLI